MITISVKSWNETLVSLEYILPLYLVVITSARYVVSSMHIKSVSRNHWSSSVFFSLFFFFFLSCLFVVIVVVCACVRACVWAGVHLDRRSSCKRKTDMHLSHGWTPPPPPPPRQKRHRTLNHIKWFPSKSNKLTVRRTLKRSSSPNNA